MEVVVHPVFDYKTLGIKTFGYANVFSSSFEEGAARLTYVDSFITFDQSAVINLVFT